MKRLILGMALVATSADAAPGGRVAGSKHDFSASGPGAYRAVSEANPCVFCHVSHQAGKYALSNRPDTTANHRPYESSTMKGRASVPGGSSRICLSCHDGTIAVGSTRKREIQLTGGNRTIAAGSRSNLGTDLRTSHPVSLVPSPGDGTREPRPDDRVKLDAWGQVQCTSCHDPHAEWGDPKRGRFLVKPNDGSDLCLSCHTSVAVGRSSHFTSPAAVTATDGRTTTVAEQACEACHDSHGADVRGRLLRPAADEDVACVACHSGTVARLDIAAESRKPWGHASNGRGVHDAAERPDGTSRRLPEVSPGTSRHVACVDCHDPHSATNEPAVAPAIPGALAGAWGVSLEGQAVEPARFEYEVCLKCHGDSANKPQASGSSGFDRVRRAFADVNLRLVFAPSSPSFHPVAATGRNGIVPSLLAPYSAASMIYCSDCHASDASVEAGGTGPRGPHGSVYAHLLERQYSTSDPSVESPATYALCYKCHDRNVLLSSASAFPLHREHVVGSSAPCSACHDAHGISNEAGNERENAHLISFDLSIVRPAGGPPRYTSEGPSRGSCNLTCHDHAHHEPNGRY